MILPVYIEVKHFRNELLFRLLVAELSGKKRFRLKTIWLAARSAASVFRNCARQATVSTRLFLPCIRRTPFGSVSNWLKSWTASEAEHGRSNRVGIRDGWVGD